MQSNRLTVTLDENMAIGYESGIQTVYLNSYLTKEFVVRPSFLLAPGESLWVTFSQTGATPQEAFMLTPRQSTKANSTRQVAQNDSSGEQITQDDTAVYEYYAELPQAVLDTVGQWKFSLDVRQVYDTENPSDYAVMASTSDVGSFVVNNSLSDVTGGPPNDKTIASLYETAVSSANAAAQSAQDAKASAEEAAQTAQDAADKVLAANKPPYIGANGNWYEYNATTQVYEDTGVKAQGPQGIAGKNGADGTNGTDGVGIATSVITYASSASGTVPPATGWTSAIPEVSQGSYLWTRTVFTLTNGTSTASYSVAYQGEDGSGPIIASPFNDIY